MGDELARRTEPGQVYRPEPIVPKTIWTDREVDQSGRVIEVHHHYHAPDPASERKLNAADKFTPYFVIMAYLVVIVGCLGIVGMMVIPPFMAAVIALTASLVSILITVSGFMIVLAVLAWIIRGMIKDSREQDQDE